jgi:hypothetical protein
MASNPGDVANDMRYSRDYESINPIRKSAGRK